jgi:hypothetical protein
MMVSAVVVGNLMATGPVIAFVVVKAVLGTGAIIPLRRIT